MTIQQPTAAPDQFIRLLDQSIEKQGLSLREVARLAGVSIAYLSRLLSKKRGLPAKKTIKKFERVLEIEPGRLFDAAGLHDVLASDVFKDEAARHFLLAIEPLSYEERSKVLQEAAQLAKKYHPKEHE